MNTQNNVSELYNTLLGLIKAGDEKAARAFLVEHLNEFPEETQKKIIFEFFSEALDNEVESGTQKTQIQKSGMDLIEEIQKTEKTLSEQKKAVDIQIDLMK